MKPQVWLSRARGIDREIDALLKTRQETFDRCISITAQLGGDSVSGTKDPHKFDSLVEIDLLITRRIDELIDIKQEVIKVISKLDNPRHRVVLHKRYVDFMTWEAIACEMGYTFQHIHRLHGDALLSIGKILKCDKM